MAKQKVKTIFSTSLGDFIFDAYFNIDITTGLTITKHPVQSGANIADHAYENPNQLSFDIGMSDVMESYVQGQFSDNNSRSISAYDTLQKIKSSRLPIEVKTRLGTYTNMMITNIHASDSAETYYGLRATVDLEEIIVVGVKTVKISERPAKTDSTENGDQNVQKAGQSLLASLLG